MSDCMTFPKTADEFIEQCSFEDSKQEYTNGSKLMPVFRVEQMLEHYYPVEVVRCKDCKHYAIWSNGRFMRHCDFHEASSYEDDFCSYGERKDNGV